MALVTTNIGRRIICDEEDDVVAFELGDTSHQNEKMPSTARALAGAVAEPRDVTNASTKNKNLESTSTPRRPRITKRATNYSNSNQTNSSSAQAPESHAATHLLQATSASTSELEVPPQATVREASNIHDRSRFAGSIINTDSSTRESCSQPAIVELPHRITTSVHAAAVQPAARTGDSVTPESRVASNNTLLHASPADSTVIEQGNDGKRVDAIISITQIRRVVERHWNLYMEHHASLLKTNLKHARTKTLTKGGASGPQSRRGKTTFSFNNSNDGNALSASSSGSIRLQHTSFPGPNTATAIKSTIEQPTLSFPSSGEAMPQYTTYIHLDKSVLVENERRLVSWPKFVGYEDAGAEYDHDVSNAYSQGLPDFWESEIPRLEMSKALGDCVEAALIELGCDFTDALRCLLDRPRDWRSGLGRQEKDYVKDLGNLIPVPNRKRTTPKKVEFERTIASWRSLLLRLPPSSPKQLHIAGLACKAVLDVCKVRMWDVATQHQKYLDCLSKKIDQKVSLSILATELCRICWSHNCLCHGEFLDESGSESEHESSTSTDSSLLRATNMKERINLRQGVAVDLGRSDMLSAEDLFYNQNQDRSITESAYLGLRRHRTSPTGTYNHELGTDADRSIPDEELCSDMCFWEISNRQNLPTRWTLQEEAQLRQQAPAYASTRRGPCLLASSLSKPCVEVFQHMLALSKKLPWKRPNMEPRTSLSIGSIVEEIKERVEHYPCSHSGPCNSTECTCFANKVECEKSCRCDSSCRRRFPGCNCKRQGRICAGNPDCRCFVHHRECDVDLCSSCGADELLDPANRSQTDKDFIRSRCHNVEIQRGVPKITHVGNSTVEAAGYGLFMGEVARKNDYVGEYIGYILSKTEADRLGVIYHELPHNYLFVANQDHEIDSLPAGNKMRFINHSSNPRTINCQAFLYLCNGAVHIALYALKDVAVGEELFFNYGYTEEQTKSFVEKRILESSASNARAGTGKNNNVALRPEHKSSKGNVDETGKPGSDTNEGGLDDWPPPMKSDSDDEDYREGGVNSKVGASGLQRRARSARKRARSSSPSEAVSHDRKRVKAR